MPSPCRGSFIRRRSTWTWKVADPAATARLHLRYEPGNWGDCLKGLWAVAAARAVLRAGKKKSLRYLDPFAGAPAYPLVEASARRLARLPPSRFRKLQRGFARRGLWASTALAVRAACRAEGGSAKLRVFDLQPLHRTAWKEEEGVEVLPVAAGAEALDAELRNRNPAGLVLVDPYDFFDRWGRLLPKLVRLARRAAVLIYLYNKSPRGQGYAHQYERFRRRLAGLLAEASPRGPSTPVDRRSPALSVLLGRLPSDAVAPRAFHEVLLMGPAGLLAPARAELQASTRGLSRLLGGLDCFEEWT